MEHNDDATLSTYLDSYKKLRERNVLKEILEREMLLAFIRANMERIAEFPLLEAEQNGIINLIIQRSSNHPCQEYIRNWLGSFLTNLNHYGKLGSRSGSESEELTKVKTELLNAENILIQYVQGVVYTVGLAKDNSSYSVVSLFGVEALEPLQEFTKTVEPDETFWRALIERFVLQRVDTAYEKLLEEKKYSLSKDESLVILRFHLDDVLRLAGAAPVQVDKTRIQASYEDVLLTDEGRNRVACLTQFLQSKLEAEALREFSEGELRHAALVVCMDSLAQELCSRLQGIIPPDEPTEAPVGTPLASDKQRFLEEQAMAMAVGTIMATSTIKQDMLRAMKELGSAELRQVGESIGNLERQPMAQALYLLFEDYFSHHLRQQAGEDSGKLLFRTLRVRRVDKSSLEPLFQLGMNRIKLKKFFSQDPDDSECFLFQAKTAAELQELVKFFQIEGELLRKLLELWRGARYKVDVLVILNLKQLAKVTTNLPQRVGEILGRFRVLSR